MNDDGNTNRVSRVSKFAKPDDQKGDKPDSDTAPIMPFAGQEMIVLMNQLGVAQSRIESLEEQLRAAEQGRREDNERLLRELMEAKIENATLNERLKQKTSGE